MVKVVGPRTKTGLVYIDFAKAFDSVVHSKLICKLQSYGIKGDLILWIRAFLANRKQRVVVGNQTSAYRPVISGTPQGSILGPILFVLYVNDLPEVVHNSITCKLYADDLKLYTNSANNGMLSNTLENVWMWSVKWQLSIAAHKCFLLHMGHNNPQIQYFLDNVPLPVQSDCRDLGITVCSDMNFSKYCKEQTTKAFRVTNIIFRCFHTNDKKALVTAFKSYVRPLLEYCTQVWSPHLLTDIDRIERVQRYFTRRLFARCGHVYTNYLQRLNVLNLEPLEVRRIRFDLKMTYNICHNLVGLSFNDFFDYVSRSGLRGHNYKLYYAFSRTNNCKFSFANRVVPIWNSLGVQIVESLNFNIFCAKLTNDQLIKFSKFNRALIH